MVFLTAEQTRRRYGARRIAFTVTKTAFAIRTSRLQNAQKLFKQLYVVKTSDANRKFWEFGSDQPGM